MRRWTASEELAGRLAFNGWRYNVDRPIPWDWADMSEAEKQQWIDRAKTEGETRASR